ncbi:HAD-IIIC family phosphatase [Rhizomonospora bruguierae]|uniref:HAD-IIIC family phosphatase n=1 Tax=Rhizomonospora bruguierae TaxID=1581705 RepID=UPI001BD0AB61|nr:HAD-IIIC family phosphatase [Micromonospora sp. NBRC 107566]
MTPGIANLRPQDGYRHWRRLAGQHGTDPRAGADVAVLATFTTDLLTELLPLAGWRHRLDLRVRRAAFGQVEQALWDPASPVCARPPRYAVLAGTVADLLPEGFTGADADAADRLVSEAVQRWTALWDRARDLRIQVVQLGFAPPAVDPLGAVSWRTAGSSSAIVHEVNSRLAARAGAGVRFVDVAWLAAQVGLSRWSDARCWHRIRQPFAMDALPWLAAAIAEAVAVHAGVTRRCVVVDLDDTLWGGVVGQDGLDGLVLRDGPAGEAYRDFQRYLRGLAHHGVILAVCSKNDPELAEQAIAGVPGMVLRRADFAAVQCGWEPKSRQLLSLARQLRIGLDAMVFVDDNPAECAEVAGALPEVAVVHLSGGPSTFPAAVASVPGLAPGRGAADAGRARSYAALARAEELRGRSRDLTEHLRSLSMTATVTTVDRADLPRVAELVAKTNQFNLTDRRRSEAELTAMLAGDSTSGFCLRLRDRFADHGLVGVAVTILDGDAAELDTLLLSCRVIGRTAERNLVAEAGRWARARGARRLIGRYVPTGRNGLVRDLFGELGFQLRDETADGIRTYEYQLDGGHPPPSPYLTNTEVAHAD